MQFQSKNLQRMTIAIMNTLWICSSYEDFRQNLKCMNGCVAMCRVSTPITNETKSMSFNSSRLMFCFYILIMHTKSSW